jgi:hypothetical protein
VVEKTLFPTRLSDSHRDRWCQSLSVDRLAAEGVKISRMLRNNKDAVLRAVIDGLTPYRDAERELTTLDLHDATMERRCRCNWCSCGERGGERISCFLYAWTVAAFPKAARLVFAESSNRQEPSVPPVTILQKLSDP